MQVHPLEKTDLGFHCDAEGERAIVFITRLRDMSASTAARADRNLVATIAIGLVVLSKGTINYGAIIKAVGCLILGICAG